MSELRILVTEDDLELNRSVCLFLRNNGYEADGFSTVEEAFQAMKETVYDLILSDIMMPNVDGIDFARRVRAQNETIPILFMTARDDLYTKQIGYHVGIDDYMVKPVDLEELLLRIGALLRRAGIASGKTITAGNLKLCVDTRTVYIDDCPVSLTVREFNFLYKLLSNPGRTFTRSQLMDNFWSSPGDAGTRSVDVYMAKLRNKISACKAVELVPVYGLGYKAVIH